MKRPIEAHRLITDADIIRAEQVLVDNGIPKEKCSEVLKAVGEELLRIDLYPKETVTRERELYVSGFRLNIRLITAALLELVEINGGQRIKIEHLNDNMPYDKYVIIGPTGTRHTQTCEKSLSFELDGYAYYIDTNDNPFFDETIYFKAKIADGQIPRKMEGDKISLLDWYVNDDVYTQMTEDQIKKAAESLLNLLVSKAPTLKTIGNRHSKVEPWQSEQE